VIKEILEQSLDKYKRKNNEGFNQFIKKLLFWNEVDDKSDTYGEFIYEMLESIEEYGVLSLVTYLYLAQAKKGDMLRTGIENIAQMSAIAAILKRVVDQTEPEKDLH
jgi:hypothetical protein